MSSLKELRWGRDPAPLAEAGRRLAAALLQRASRLLARLRAPAWRTLRRNRPEPRFEFHAEAGAPEGALTWTVASSAGSPACDGYERPERRSLQGGRRFRFMSDHLQPASPTPFPFRRALCHHRKAAPGACRHGDIV